MFTQNLTRGAIAAGASAHVVNHNLQGTGAWCIFGQIPDLVNGNTADYRYIFATAGLASEWHWVDDACFAALPATDTQANLRLRICSEAIFHSLFLQRTAQPVDAGKARIMSVLLAASRLSIRRAYGVVNDDIVESQLTHGFSNVRGQSDLLANGELAADVPRSVTQAEWVDERDALVLVYDALADTFVPNFIHAAIGMPPCNGGTIVTTGVHHYVGSHKVICDAVFKQVFGTSVVPPGGLTVDELKDLLCHKAAHPIKSPILVGLARSVLLKDRLAAVNLGSAAVRIPFHFAPEKAASAYLALVRQVNQAGPSSNVLVDMRPAKKLMDDVTAAIEANPGSTGLRNATELVQTFKQEHGYNLAWCAGFMTALFDSTSTPPRGRSVVNALSLTSIKDDNAAAVAEGADHYGAAAKWRRARAKEGHLAGFGLFGAKSPPAFTNPELGGTPAPAPASAPAPAAAP
jgi:hypothetical protein